MSSLNQVGAMDFIVAIFLCFYLFALSIGLVFKVLTALFIRNPISSSIRFFTIFT